MSGNETVGRQQEINEETLLYIRERSENIARYSDKLSRAIEEINSYFERVGPLSGIRYIEPRIFHEDDDDDYNRFYSLAVESYGGKWGLKVVTFDSEEKWAEWTSLKSASSCSRFVKKLIIEEAISIFIQSYADELKRIEKDYANVSEKAESISNILKERVEDENK